MKAIYSAPLAEYKINLLLATKAEENMDMSSIMDMCREGQNTATDNALTVCISAGGQTLSYTSGKYDVSVSKNSFVGLFNEWLGTGASFDIKLEKDFIFPVSLIKEIRFEGANRRYGYHTVKKVYDFIPSVWRGEVRVAKEKGR